MSSNNGPPLVSRELTLLSFYGGGGDCGRDVSSGWAKQTKAVSASESTTVLLIVILRSDNTKRMRKVSLLFGFAFVIVARVGYREVKERDYLHIMDRPTPGDHFPSLQRVCAFRPSFSVLVLHHIPHPPYPFIPHAVVHSKRRHTCTFSRLFVGG